MIRAVLFDRDGTLIADTRGGDIIPMPGALQALQALRSRGFLTGVVTNQPAVGDGLIAPAQLRAVHDRIDALLGRMDGWFVCMHSADARCACRKPAPGLIQQACRAFGVAPGECAVIGDIGSDVEAAHNAGAYGVLVPTPVTQIEEIARAPVVCEGLLDAVRHVIALEAAA